MSSLENLFSYTEYRGIQKVPTFLVRFQILSKKKGSRLISAFAPLIYSSLGYEIDIINNQEHLDIFCKLLIKNYTLIFPKKGVDQKKIYVYDRVNQIGFEVIEENGYYNIIEKVKVSFTQLIRFIAEYVFALKISKSYLLFGKMIYNRNLLQCTITYLKKSHSLKILWKIPKTDVPYKIETIDNVKEYKIIGNFKHIDKLISMSNTIANFGGRGKDLSCYIKVGFNYCIQAFLTLRRIIKFSKDTEGNIVDPSQFFVTLSQKTFKKWFQEIHLQNQKRTILGKQNEQMVQDILTKYKIQFIHNKESSNTELDIYIQDVRFGEKPIIIEVTTDKNGAYYKCGYRQTSLIQCDYIVTTQDKENELTLYKIESDENSFWLGDPQKFTEWIENHLME